MRRSTSLHRCLWRPWSPAQVWPQDRLRPPPGQYLKETTVEGHIQTCIYQAPVPQKFEPPCCRHHRQDQPAPVCAASVLLSSDLELRRTRHSLTIMGCDASRSLTRDANDMGPRRLYASPPAGSRMQRTSRCSWSMWPTSSGRMSMHGPRLQRPGPESRLPRRQIRGGNDTNASGKPEPVLLAKILDHVASLGRIHVSQSSASFV